MNKCVCVCVCAVCVYVCVCCVCVVCVCSRARTPYTLALWQALAATRKRAQTVFGLGSAPITDPLFRGFGIPNRSPDRTCTQAARGSVTRVSILHATFPFPPRRTGEYWKGMISARPLYQGVRRSVWDPETFTPEHKSRAEARPRGALSLGSG